MKELFKNKLVKETVWSFLTKGITFSLYFSLSIYLARTLKISEFGAWSYFYSIFTTILYISFFGINASTKKYIAQYNKTDNLGHVLKSSLQLRVICSLLFALIILFIHEPLIFLLKRPDLNILFLCVPPLLFLSGCLEYFKSVFSGLHRIKYIFILNCLEHGSKLLLGILFLHYYFHLISILTAFTISILMAVVVGVFLIKKNFYKIKAKHHEDFRSGILRYSLPLYLAAIGFLLATEIDILMLGWFSSDIEVGLYSIPKQIVGKSAHISVAIAMGTLPVFAKLNKDNYKKLQKLYNRLLKINFIIYFSISLLIILFADSFIPFIFGDEYIGSVLPLKILSIYLLFTPFRSFSGSLLNYCGIAWARALMLICSTIFNIIMNYFLIPKYGAAGAATATAVCYLPYAFFNWIYSKKVFLSYN